MHLVWFTGDYMDKIEFPSDFASDGDFHDYVMEWTNSSMRWYGDGAVLYERSDDLFDCGSGPAIDNYTEALYEYFSTSEDSWVAVAGDAGFFYNDAGTKCNFTYDTSAIITQPMTIRAIVPEFGVSPQITGSLELSELSYRRGGRGLGGRQELEPLGRLPRDVRHVHAGQRRRGLDGERVRHERARRVPRRVDVRADARLLRRRHRRRGRARDRPRRRASHRRARVPATRRG